MKYFFKKEITERLKYLSTTDKDKMEAKGKDREEVEFFGKFILCSNNEDNFIQIDEEEIRFWIIKVKSIKKRILNFFKTLSKKSPFSSLSHSKTFQTQKKQECGLRF
jgi:hypothetical protein